MDGRILPHQRKPDKRRGASPAEFRVDPALVRFTERRRELERVEAVRQNTRELRLLRVAVETLVEAVRPIRAAS